MVFYKKNKIKVLTLKKQSGGQGQIAQPGYKDHLCFKTT